MTAFIIILSLLVVFALYICLIFPDRNADAALMARLKDSSYAHRGLHDAQLPENSIPAFLAAAENGFGIELDLQLSKDNKVVVFHDGSLMRVCGIDRRVSELTAEELSKLRLCGKDMGIPLFSDVLAHIKGRVPIIAELKHTKNRELLCSLTLGILNAYDGDYCVESFDPLILRWFAKNAPRIIRGQLSANRIGLDAGSVFLRFVLSNMLLNIVSRPHFIAYGIDGMTNLSYRLCTEILGAASAAWTVRDAVTFEQLKKTCDMQIFEGFIPESNCQAL